MPVQSVIVHLPDVLYARLRQRAEQAQRSVEDELLEVVATAVPASEELPGELAEAVASLALLDDVALERAARSRLAAEAAERMEALHLQQQRQGLTATEAGELAGLVH